MNCKISSFGTEPYLITVGDDCLFAAGVLLITHDGGIKVLNSLGKFNGERMDKIQPIVIGNNVYIGTGAYIMPGVHIGDNCIIAAGTVVTKNIPTGSVVTGIPAKVIYDIDTYYERCVLKGNLYPTGNMTADEKRRYIEGKLKP
ncbi:Maltose O-acetyltransferase [Dehalobacter sp. UNSWDHB]|nr:Maltose O-acetyltransferase [Dehalobacter sp. UNSWDHB]